MADITFTDNSDEILRQMAQKIDAGLEACGNQAVTHAKNILTAGIKRHADSWYTPTGALRNSITHAVSDGEVQIGTNMEYAIYNEYGTGVYLESDNGVQGRQTPWAYEGPDGEVHWTRGMKALHFLKNAVDNHKEQYINILKQFLNR